MVVPTLPVGESVERADTFDLVDRAQLQMILKIEANTGQVAQGLDPQRTQPHGAILAR